MNITYKRTIHRRAVKMNVSADSIQFNFACWLLKRTTVAPASLIGDLAFAWAGF